MAYDRFDPWQGPREDRSRWSDDRENRDRGPGGRDSRERGFGGRDERGFFERAGEQIASWFGDEEDDRRPRDDSMRGREREFGSSSGRDRPRSDRDYRPITGDYGRAQGNWDRDQHRRPSFAGSSERSQQQQQQPHDPHYREWRQRQIEDLDRDYDEYRREHQSKFENDFGSWRQTRQTKRQMIGLIREHMEVVGNDDEHVGKVDRIAGDRIILTKSDPEAGDAHHSLSCTDVDRIESDRVILDCSAEQARQRWRYESRGRALFEREDQGEAGPHMLDRSFSGTYR